MYPQKIQQLFPVGESFLMNKIDKCSQSDTSTYTTQGWRVRH